MVTRASFLVQMLAKLEKRVKNKEAVGEGSTQDAISNELEALIGDNFGEGGMGESFF